MSPIFILTAVYIQHYALMRRALEFKTISIIDLAANTISSLIAVAMAVSGYGYWSLVAKLVAQSSLTALGAWVSCRWSPGLPQISSGARELVGFGLGVTGFTVMDTFSRSTDKVALGYFGGASSLGYFQNAYLLYSNVLNIITEPVHNIGVSSLSKLRDNISQLKRAWSAALSLVALFSALAFSILAVIAQDLTIVLLGSKWAAAGPLLCVFAIRGIPASVERTMGWLHVVAGRSDRWMRWGVFSAVVHLIALAIGLQFGAMGVAVAYTVAMFLLFVPALVYGGRPIGIGVKDVLLVTGPQVGSALVTVVLGISIRSMFMAEFSDLTRCVISIPICTCIYLALMIVLSGKADHPLKTALSILIKSFRSGDSEVAAK